MEASSDSDNGLAQPPSWLFGRQRPIHAVLGGGQVANVLLWRDKRISAILVAGTAAIWFLFEVVEYSLISLLCHICITTMLIIFICSSAAQFLKWNLPNIPNIILQDSTLRDFALIFHRKLNQLLVGFVIIACGYNPGLFFLTIISLWIISVIGNSISSLNLLFFGFVCLETLPFLYEKYEDEVDRFGYKLSKKIKKLCRKVWEEFAERIPKGPAKDE